MGMGVPIGASFGVRSEAKLGVASISEVSGAGHMSPWSSTRARRGAVLQNDKSASQIAHGLLLPANSTPPSSPRPSLHISVEPSHRPETARIASYTEGVLVKSKQSSTKDQKGPINPPSSRPASPVSNVVQGRLRARSDPTTSQPKRPSVSYKASSPQRSRTGSDPAKRASIILESYGKSRKIEIQDPIKLILPDIRLLHFRTWLRNDLLKKANPKRIKYDLKDIGKALKTFTEQFGCQWRIMKEKCKEPWVMQVVNDLRAFALEKLVFTPLKTHFNEKLKHLLAPFGEAFEKRFIENGVLNIVNAGSTDVKSDCDASLGFRELHDSMWVEYTKAQTILKLLQSDKNMPPKELEKQKAIILNMENALEKLSSQLGTLETEAVEMANNLSQKATAKGSWATIFDSNFYPQFELIRATNPELEIQRTEQQQLASLLMFSRTAPESFERFKESVTEKIKLTDNSDQLTLVNRLLTQVVDLNQELNVAYYKKVIELSADPAQVESLKKDLAAEEFDGIAEAAKALIKRDPEISKQASKELHIEYKASAARYNLIHKQLYFMQLSLDRDTQGEDSNQFSINFNKGIQVCIDHLDEELKELETQPPTASNKAKIAELENRKKALDARFKEIASTTDPQAFKEAFVARRALEKKSSSLVEMRIFLEGARKTLNDLEKENLKNPSDEKLSLKISERKREIRAKLTKLTQNRDDLSNILKDKSLKLSGSVNALISCVDTDLNEIEKERKYLATTIHGDNWIKAGTLENERDEALILKQKADFKASLFAEEAHVSLDAMEKVVGDQLGKIGAHNPARLVNAHIEVFAFFIAHQESLEEGWNKMKEASKYGDRMGNFNAETDERCDALNIAPPPIDNSDPVYSLDNLRVFEQEMRKLRSDDNLSPEIKEEKALDLMEPFLAEELKQQIRSEMHGQSEEEIKAQIREATIDNQMQIAEAINTRFSEINVDLFVWITSLPKEVQNAYYRKGENL